ncbi:GSU2403 family nucleotidyltransferase fold protein [Piscinibacter sp.]|jgi:hypothetical protein|uniref:GSU2403 family nucleotidyltransferase fold protein n=1 Tax=Piscinibacter sp. TaxID=1903157 RepID=UPI00355AA9C2
MSTLYRELSLAAQTTYAEVLDQSRALELNALAGLTGAFHRRTIKGCDYIYFGYRDPIDGAQRRVYVGPADERVNALVARFNDIKAPKQLAPNAQAALALGCAGTLPKHHRIVRQLAAYGFFKAGGVLIGTHAFIAMSNMLGVRWVSGDKTLDVDFAHAGRNVSLALPSDVQLSVHDALSSLEMGLLPIRELSRKAGAQYRNPRDPELRLDFLTSLTSDGEPVVIDRLGLALEPLKFMEFSLEGTTQAALLSRDGACLVNIPAPARYAVHKLIVYGERDTAARVKALKDIEQAAALAEWHLRAGQAATFNAAWVDALKRGKGWRTRAQEGRSALVAKHPALDDKALWRGPRSAALSP